MTPKVVKTDTQEEEAQEEPAADEYSCGNCNAIVFSDEKFCPSCGKKLMW